MDYPYRENTKKPTRLHDNIFPFIIQGFNDLDSKYSLLTYN